MKSADLSWQPYNIEIRIYSKLNALHSVFCVDSVGDLVSGELGGQLDKYRSLNMNESNEAGFSGAKATNKRRRTKSDSNSEDPENEIIKNMKHFDVLYAKPWLKFLIFLFKFKTWFLFLIL